VHEGQEEEATARSEFGESGNFAEGIALANSGGFRAAARFGDYNERARDIDVLTNP